MQSSELINTLRKIIPSSDSKNIISALRQDPLVWESLLDDTFFLLVKGQAEIKPTIWTPAELASLAINNPPKNSDMDDESAKIQNLELERSVSEEYKKAISTGEVPTSLRQAGLIAKGLLEKHVGGVPWFELCKEITPKSSMTVEHAYRLWRTPLAILYGLLPDKMAFLQALIPERGSKTSFEWISHIILANPMAFQDQVKILFVLMAHLPLGSRVGWLIILSRLGKKELVVEISRMILAARSQPESTQKNGSPVIQNEDELAVNGVEAQYLATRQQLANNPEEAKGLIEHASDQLKEWLHNLDQLKDGMEMGDNTQSLLETELLDEENPVYEIMKTGELKADHQTNHERIKEAARKLIDLIHEDPETIFPRFALGWEPTQIIKKLEELGFHQEAMECVSGFIKMRPSDIALIEEAVKLCSMMENYSKAVEYAGLLVLLEPENMTWRRQLAEQYALNGDLDFALEEQQEILASNQLPDVGDWVRMADLALRAGDVTKALDACNAVLAAEPENALALGFLGRANIDKGNIDDAIQYLSRATLIAPEMDKPWLYLFEALKKKNEPEKAIDSLRSAVLASPTSPLINFELAKACLEKGSKAEALPYLKKAAKLSPDSLPVVLELVKALGDLGHSSDAKEIIESSRQKWPGQPDLAYAHAKILQAAGESQAAILAFEKAIAAKPERTDWIIEYAESLLGDNGDFILGKNITLSLSALEAARDAIDRTGSNSDIRRDILLAELNLASDKFDVAYELYSKLKETSSDKENPWSWRLQTGLAKTALALGKNDVALVALSEAIKEKQDMKELYQMQAEASLSVNLPEEALTAGNRALELEPDDIENIIWHANLMMKLGNKEQATTSLSRAIDIFPDRTDLLVKLADMQFATGRQDQSRKGLEEILDLGCTDMGDLQEGAKIALEMGDQQLALSFLERAVALDTESRSNLRIILAGLYKNLNDLPAALSQIQSAIQEHPDNGSLFVFQADILKEMDRSEAALESLEHAKEKVLTNPNFDQEKLEVDPMGQFIPERWKGIENLATISYRQMKYFQEHGDLVNALTCAENTLKENPGNLDLRLLIIQLSFEILNDKEAFELADFAGLTSNHEVNQHISVDQIRDLFPALTCLRANILIENGDFEQAKQLIESTSSISNVDQIVLFTKARIERNQGRLAEAARLFETALSLDDAEHGLESIPEDISAVLRYELNSYWKAETALDLQQWERAAEYFNAHIKDFPNSPRAHFGKAKFVAVAAENNRFLQAINVIAHDPHQILPGETGSDHFYKELSLAEGDADSLLITRWKARGNAIFNPDLNAIKGLAALPKHPQDAAALITSLRDTRNIQAALQVAQKFPENAQVLAALAQNLRKNNPEGAMKAIEKVLTLEEESPVYLALAAEITEGLDDIPLAVQHLSKALTFWPDEPEWQSWAARLYDEIGQTDKAIHHWEQVMVLQPEDLTPSIALGDTYLRNSEYDKAATVLENAKKLNSNTPKIYMSLAEAYLHLEQYQLALDNAASAGQLDIKSAKPLVLCGKISKQMNDLQKAQDFAESALQREPEDLEAILFAAEITEDRKGPNSALSLIGGMIESGNNSKGIQIAKSVLLRKAGKKADAFSEIKKLAIDDTDDPRILSELAKSQAEMGYLLDAMDTASKALKVDADNAEMHLLIGVNQGHAGQLDLAIHHLIETIRIDPKCIDAYLELGEMYQQRREFNLARKVFQDAIQANPNNSRLHFQLGLALKEAKDFAGSEAMLRKAAELDPRDVKIRRQLGAVIALNLVQNAQEVNQIS